MLVHQPLRDGKTQPRAFASTLDAGADLIELVENGLLLVFRNADPRVRDRDLGQAVAALGLDTDPAAGRRELYGVREKVVQNLFEAEPVRANGR